MTFRSGLLSGVVTSVLLLVALLFLRAPFAELSLPYATMLGVLLPLVALWSTGNMAFLAGFAGISCALLPLWGFVGVFAVVLLLSWTALWAGLARRFGAGRTAALLAVAVLLCFFSPFYVKAFAPHGGLWLHFSLISGPLPALWDVLGCLCRYDGRVGTLLYNRWYGTQFPIVLPRWWVLAAGYLAAGLVLLAPWKMPAAAQAVTFEKK